MSTEKIRIARPSEEELFLILQLDPEERLAALLRAGRDKAMKALAKTEPAPTDPPQMRREKE